MAIDLLLHAVEQAEAGFVPGSDGSFEWEMLGHDLVLGFENTFGSQERIPTPTARKKVASFIAQRVPRRVGALTILFRNGMYSEAIPIVRAAYEDWLTSAYLLLRPGQEHCDDFWFEDQYRLLAKSYNAWARLMPDQAIDRFVKPGEKEKFAKYLKTENKKLLPLGRIQWRQMAARVGLADVHDWAYTHLSGLAHGSPLNAAMTINFQPGSDVGVADPMQRNEDREHLPAIWAYWFNLRSLTLCAKEFEFEFDLEDQSKVILDCLQGAPRDPTLSAIRREQLQP